MSKEEMSAGATVVFGMAKIGLIAILAYGQCDAASRINALEARVRDLAMHVEAKAAVGRHDLVAVGELALPVGGAHDERIDADVAGAAVLDDDAAVERIGADHEADARRKALADAVDDLEADAKRGDGGEQEGEGLVDVDVHGADYTKTTQTKETTR